MVSTAACQFSALSLNSLRLKVKLGCSAEERLNYQYVRFDIRLRFPMLPPIRPQGCVTDQLKDTVCYADLSERVRKVCEQKEYQLIEKLGWDAFLAVKELLPTDIKLWMCATKEKPPVPDLEGGASFYLGDWNEF